MMLHAVFLILVPATKLAKYQIEVIKELKLKLKRNVSFIKFLFFLFLQSHNKRVICFIR